MTSHRFHQLEISRALAIVQVQATGNNPRQDRIVAVTVRRIEADGSTLVRHFWVNPGISPETMLAIARSTNRGRLVRVPTFRTVRHWLTELLEDCDLAGFGLKQFDLPILQAEFARTSSRLDLSGRAIVDCQQIFDRLHANDLETAAGTYLGRHLPYGTSPAKRLRVVAELLDNLLTAYPFLPRTPAGLSTRFGRQDGFRRQIAMLSASGWATDASRKPVGQRLQEEPGLFYTAWWRDMLSDLPSLQRRSINGGWR